jgi:phosphatidate cytidylyltransferase
MEFYRMTAAELSRLIRLSGYILLILLFVALSLRQVLLVIPIVSLLAFVPLTIALLSRPSPDKMHTYPIGLALLGPVYVGFPLGMLILVDLFPRGNVWIFFLLALIFANDTGAFYFGRTLGRHKLYPAISPGKTWEGAFGGLLTSMAVAILFLSLIPLKRIDVGVLILTVVLSISAQVGDLVESMLKRSHGMKDSGRILPGHGGLLDRIDGLIFAIPVLFVYISLFVV